MNNAVADTTLRPTVAASRPALSRPGQRRLFLVAVLASDALCLLAAFAFAYWLRFYTNLPFFDEVPPSPAQHAWLVLGLIPAWMMLFALLHLYDYHYLLGGTNEYGRVFSASAVAPSLLILFTFFVPIVRVSRGWITISWVLAFILVCLGRFFVRRAAYFLRRRGYLRERTLIVGTDDEAHAIADQLHSTPTGGAEIVGFVMNHLPEPAPSANGLPIVGRIDELPSLVKSLEIEQLIVSTAALERQQLINVFETFANSEQVDLRFSSGLYELYTTGMHVRELGSVPLVTMNKVRLDTFETVVKALLDRSLALSLLLLLSPVLAILAILVKLDSPGPALHRRKVLGRGDRAFLAYKFRTMFQDGDAILSAHPELARQLSSNQKLRDDPRVTRLGRFLRRWSLDELPQLWNVLRGQMSLVGPRMIAPEEAEPYGKLRTNLLTVQPGLTGLWQIRGRSDLSYDERIRLDMYYIRNYSIWLDLQILLQTLPVVLRGRGAY